MHVHMRLDEVNDSEGIGHIVETVIIDGKEVGQLRLTTGQYQLFGAALGLGSDLTRGHLRVTHDPIAFGEDGNFKMPEIGEEAVP